MIGNDVVDILAARRDSNIWRKDWQEKLFTANERAFINASQDAEVAVWLLWSMKEAAYKAWNRQKGIRTFAPQKLQCTVDFFKNRYASGQVTFENDVYYTKSSLSQPRIHTIAAQSVKMLNDIQYVNHQAAVPRGKALLPHFKVNGVWQPASKSHHGIYNIAVGLIIH